MEDEIRDLTHKGHNVMSFNEHLVKEGREEDVSVLNEGISWCESCKEEFIGG